MFPSKAAVIDITSTKQISFTVEGSGSSIFRTDMMKTGRYTFAMGPYVKVTYTPSTRNLKVYGDYYELPEGEDEPEPGWC
jgi:hypothetical protein